MFILTNQQTEQFSVSRVCRCNVETEHISHQLSVHLHTVNPPFKVAIKKKKLSPNSTYSTANGFDLCPPCLCSDYVHWVTFFGRTRNLRSFRLDVSHEQTNAFTVIMRVRPLVPTNSYLEFQFETRNSLSARWREPHCYHGNRKRLS